VGAVVKVLFENADRARALVRRAAPRIAGDKSADQCSCRNALEHAIITAPEVRDPKLMERLSVVAGRVLKKEKPA
jgi:5'-methylthioadenosine phosphorylase